MQKWDTNLYIDFDFALHLAKELKYFVSGSPLVDHYRENKKRLCAICKRAKVECDLKLILKNEDFFMKGNNDYLILRDFILNKIRTGLDFYNVDDFNGDYLF